MNECLLLILVFSMFAAPLSFLAWWCNSDVARCIRECSKKKDNEKRLARALKDLGIAGWGSLENYIDSRISSKIDNHVTKYEHVSKEANSTSKYWYTYDGITSSNGCSVEVPERCKKPTAKKRKK
jgi:hypothetical protein